MPVAFENPMSSLMWQEPLLSHLLTLPTCNTTVFDFCAHGTRWRKSTRLASWRCCAAPEALARRCHSVG
eukprot:516215-Pyramimonas_sp.AAC.1